VKLLLLALLLVPLLSTAYADNSLENTILKAKSAVISLEIEFGEDSATQFNSKNDIAKVNAVSLMIYDMEIPLSNPQVKIFDNGNNFRISSISDGVMMYGHKNSELGNYKINLYLASDSGQEKFSVNTDIQRDDDKNIEKIVTIKEKSQYVPILKMTSSHDFRTFWNDVFNIDVQTFDGRHNSNPKESNFNGRIDGVDISVLLSLDETLITTLSGITANNGNWKGEYFFKENLSAPGEYDVDVIASYLGETVSESSTMFVFPTTMSSKTSQHFPVANAGADYSEPANPDCKHTLDGSGSYDANGDSLTYFWDNVSGFGLINDKNAEITFFTNCATGTIVMELTVTDSTGRSSSDRVVVTLTTP